MSNEESKRIHISRKVWFLVIPSIVLISGVAIFYHTPFLIFTERLRINEFERKGTNAYSTKVWDSEGNDLAHPYFLIPSNVSESPVWFQFSMWHAEGTHLDSITLVFSSNIWFDIAWQATGYNWPETDFRKTSDGNRVILAIPNLGFVGTGTVRLEFYLQSPHLTQFPRHLDFFINLQFSLHKEPPFSFTQYTADTSLSVVMEMNE